MSSKRRFRRFFTSNVSNIFCFSDSFNERLAAIESANLPGSVIDVRDDKISGGIFLLSLTYWSNWEKTDLMKAFVFLSFGSLVFTIDASAVK